MLKDQINKDYMTAFKDRDTVKKNLLSVIKGEIQTQEKNQGIDNMSDDEVTKILNKMAKSLREVFVTDNSQVLTDVRIELDIIEAYFNRLTADVNSQIMTSVRRRMPYIGKYSLIKFGLKFQQAKYAISDSLKAIRNVFRAKI